jgi:hypothetical protein
MLTTRQFFKKFCVMQFVVRGILRQNFFDKALGYGSVIVSMLICKGRGSK